MMDELIFERATLPYLPILQRLAIETFQDTYGSMNSVENMNAYIEKAFNQQVLADEIQSPLHQYWLAFMGHELVGYIKINFNNPIPIENHHARSLEVERIYVVRNLKGKRIGSQLMQKATEIAREHGMESIWLGVWEKNETAIRFYQKMGFKQVGSHWFTLGEEDQLDYLMEFFI